MEMFRNKHLKRGCGIGCHASIASNLRMVRGDLRYGTDPVATNLAAARQFYLVFELISCMRFVVMQSLLHCFVVSPPLVIIQSKDWILVQSGAIYPLLTIFADVYSFEIVIFPELLKLFQSISDLNKSILKEIKIANLNSNSYYCKREIYYHIHEIHFTSS